MMEGLNLKLYKNPISHADKDTTVTNAHVVYMHYDYLEAIPIYQFKDYFMKMYSNGDGETKPRKDYYGSIQCMYLYPIERESNLEFAVFNKDDESNVGKYLVFNKNDSSIPQFMCITAIKLANNQGENDSTKSDSDKKDYKQFLEQCVGEFTAEIDDWKKNTGREFAFRFYGTLGNEDLIFIQASHSIQTLIYNIEVLRHYSLSSETCRMDSTNSYVINNLQKIGEDASLDEFISISLTFNPQRDNQQYIENITAIAEQSSDSLDDSTKMKKSSVSMIGKFDMRLFIEENQKTIITNLFYGKDAPLNTRNPEYQKYVYQSRTNWLYDYQNFQKEYEQYYPEKKYLDKGKFQHEEDIKDVLEMINHLTGKEDNEEKNNGRLKLFEKTPYLENVIWSLFYDYSKNMHSVYGELWRKDMTEQIKALVKILMEFDNINNQTPENGQLDTYALFEDVVNAIRETYVHINQANRVTFEISESNLRYSGSFTKILRAYYGVVHTLLCIGYSMGRESNTKQGKIVPIINFEYTPKIRTKYYGNMYDPSSEMIVIFSLPYAALTDIPKYSRLLCHEVFHYIAPADRYKRNEIFMELVVYQGIQKIIETFLSIIIQSKNVIINITEEKRKKLIQAMAICFVTKRKNEFLSTLKASLIIDDFSGCSFDNLEQKLLDFLFDRNDQGFELKFIEFCNQVLLDFIREMENPGEDSLTSMIGKKIASDESMNQLYDQIKRLIKGLKANECKAVCYFSIKQLDIFEVTVKTTFHAIKEACCDYFMINVTGMDFHQYLVCLEDFYYENNIKIGETRDTVVDQSRTSRYGMMIDYFFGLSDEKDLMTFYKISTAGFTDVSKEFIEGMGSLLANYIDRIGFVGERTVEDYYFSFLEINDFVQCFGEDELSNKLIKIFDWIYNGDLHLDKDELDLWMINYFYYGFHLENEPNKYQHVLKKHKNGRPSDDGQSVSAIIAESGHLPSIRVVDFHEYLIALNEATRCIVGNQSHDRQEKYVWFRGEEKATFHLIPSLFREENYKAALASRLEAYCDYFDHVSATSFELSQIRNGRLGGMDEITAMQHYGLPTHLLDWSENALVSLFFSVYKGEAGENDRVVYLLNPFRLNQARNFLLYLLELDERDFKNEIKMQKKYNEFMEHHFERQIMDFSNDYYSRDYGDYFPFCDSKCSFRDYETQLKPKKRIRKDILRLLSVFPIGCLTRMNTQRIKAQSGTFTVFNLQTPYDRKTGLEKNKRYEYASLDKCVETYHCLLEEIGIRESRPFLFKIVIDKSAVGEMRQRLNVLGFSVGKVYPELEKVCGEVKDIVVKMFS